GGGERAEDEQQHDQRQRQRVFARLRQLLAEQLVQRLAEAYGAGLADVEARIGLRDGGRRARERADVLRRLLLRALHLPLDERRVPVARDLVDVRASERRAQIADRLGRGDRAHDVVDGGPEGGVGDRLFLALDHDDLRERI